MSQETPTLDQKIYKIKQLVNGEVNTIYIFNGKIASENEEELFQKIFTPEEISEIKSGSISVVFSEQQINFDDSIATIKIKILNELKRDVSIEEIYLYCQKIETLNAVAVYQSLTQNGKLQLTKLRLDQFLSNIISDENGNPFEAPEEKEIYTFDDIFQMKFDNKKYVVNKVLGQKFFIVENEYPFVCNPFEVDDYDKLLEKNARKSLSTLNNHLLLNSGDIFDNSIFLCLAEDVLSFVATKDISEESTIKIYYPFLYNKNINDLSDLTKERSKFVENNKKILNEQVIDSFKTIDMFYNIYKLRKTELNYVKKGIKFIKAVIRPQFDVKIPLEIIFKIIHATKEKPLIKYNPSSRQENVYRLFTDKIATDGRKIPFLKKAIIFKLMKNIARNKSVGVYIESGEQSFVCDFDEEGYITIITDFKNIVSVDEINEIFKAAINPLIQEIKIVLEQSGYKLDSFESLNDENIEIKQLTYETQIYIKKPLDLDAYRSCISSIFINETNKFRGNTIDLRFKRVSNYSKFTSQEAFILEKSGQGLRGEEIIDALLENFSEDLDRKGAVEMVMRFANELEVERGVRKSDIKIKNNPGFKTIITLDKETGIITITTENINNINYLYTLPIYLDTMVRLTQDKTSTLYPVAEITQMCSLGEKGELSINDIVSSVEESASNSEVVTIQDEDVIYDKTGVTLPTEKPKGALSLFFDEDDDEDEDEYEPEDLKGGVGSNSSIESEPTDQSDGDFVESPENIEPASDSVSSDTIYSDKVLEDFDTSSSQNSQSNIDIESLNIDSPAVESLNIDSPAVDSPAVDSPAVDSLNIDSPAVESLNIDSLNIDSPAVESLNIDSPAVESPAVESLNIDSPIEEPKKEFVSFENVEKASEKIPVLDVDSHSELSENEKEFTEKDLENIHVEIEEPQEDEEYEEEDEEDEEEEVRNIDGMKLNKPYYFQTRIEKMDPVLILKEDTPQFNSYPRTCSSNMRRQPVILTDTQLEKINKEHPGFLRDEDVVKYGSNPDNKFNYICPRYWCLKTNTIIEPKDLKEVKGADGKTELVHPTCGKVLPKGEKKVKPGYYIYEFYKPKPGNKDSKKYPSLIPDSHPDGYCLPCCFDKYNTEGRIKAMEKCTKGKGDEVKQLSEKEQDSYIKGPDKFPLEAGRWGYLPVEIQTMLHVANADCQISKTNTNIKDNHPCLLRHGIEVNHKQSFVSCMSDVIFFAKKGKSNVASILNVKEMKEYIIDSISIDLFIKYQNGNLVTDFQDLDKSVDLNAYSESKIFSKLNMSNHEDKSYFTKVVTAFENFIDFLRDPDVFIDHTYLWDIISMPNQKLFPNGVNLVIMQINNDDITNNVSILCPTNHYSSEFYQARKPTIILLKKDEYYEPIYSYTNTNTEGVKGIIVSKEFKEYDPKLSKTMRAVFKNIIKPFFNLICRPLDSMPNVYKSKRALLLYDLVQKLDKYEYTIKKLVVNFNNKVIGVVAEEPRESGKICFIPCYPSQLDETLKKELDYVFMTDLGLWNTYQNTIEFLNKLDKRSKKRRDVADIPCKPAFKVVEDEHVVGILTNTNQFIQLSQPLRLDEVPPKLDIPSISNNNYIIDVNKTPMVQSEVEFTTKTDVDEERVDYIKRIRLETSFYNVFRNTIRILINNYENVVVREKIEKEMEKEYIIYPEKLKNIDNYLRELVGDKIQFIGDKNYYKLISEVSTCIVKDKDSCNAMPNLCAVTEGGKCNMILPEKNLMTQKLNEDIYYSRLADELIRYSRIKSFMLQPQVYLSFGNIGYNLKDDEIILMQSLLTQEYFETLVPAITNKYAKYISYDEVQPVKTQVYDNTFTTMEEPDASKRDVACEKITKERITSSVWSSCFPENYYEVVYGKNNSCTFEFIIDLIERRTGEKFTISQIKNQLFDEYKMYLGEYINKIVDILILEGKKTLGDQVHAGILSFANLVYTENYFLTTFDLWLLVVKYKIPTIFISQKTILQTNHEKTEFVGYGNREDSFAFVVVPGFRPENIPGYKLILTNDGDAFISLDKLNDDCVERIYKAIENPITIENYLLNFNKQKKTIYVKKKPVGPILIESDSEDTLPPVIKPKVTRKKKNVIEEENIAPVIKPKVFRKKKIVIEEDDISSVIKETKKQSKKKSPKEKKVGTKKNIKKPGIKIVDED